jgi:hypothetical protein
MELEMECGDEVTRHECLKILRDSRPEYFYCKEDSSLECGIELVTHPADYEVWVKRRGEVAEILGLLKNAGATAWGERSCGMHIHASRSPVSTLHVYKLLRFAYSNATFMFNLSGRRSQETLDDMASLRGALRDASRKAKAGLGDTRYEAINLQNTHTLEFRLFQGTLNVGRVYRNLELVKALLEFTVEAAIDKLDGSGLWSYVVNHKKQFPGLAARYCGGKNVLTGGE